MENPYQAPQSPPEDNGENPQRVASRWHRLGASFIDGILGLVLGLPVLYFLGIMEYVGNGEEPPQKLLIFSWIISLTLFMALHGYLLKSAGQTIGKYLLGIRIVSMSGQRVPLPELLLKRYVPVWLVSFLPHGAILSLIDVLFIFGDDKRCVHDYIAGTKVVEV